MSFELHLTRNALNFESVLSRIEASNRVIIASHGLGKLRRIPHHRVGHFIYYDASEVAAHIRTRLKVPARG